MSRFYDPVSSGTVAIAPPRRLDDAEEDTVAHAFAEAECPTRLETGAGVGDGTVPANISIAGRARRAASRGASRRRACESTSLGLHLYRRDERAAQRCGRAEEHRRDLDLQVRSPSGPTRTLHLDFQKHVKKVTMKRKGDKRSPPYEADHHRSGALQRRQAPSRGCLMGHGADFARGAARPLKYSVD